jgi:hypothetical protein
VIIIKNDVFENIKKTAENISISEISGSYTLDDCTFLLKDLSDKIKIVSIEEKEKIINSGINYSEVLSKEEIPDEEYTKLFIDSTEKFKYEIAAYTALLSEKILSFRGNSFILVSLARAGSPVGVLLKKYFKEKYNLEIPHYSISIIRGKGIDENALLHIINKHKTENLQFIDGWVGKGAIFKELKEAVNIFNQKYQTDINPELGVIADPTGLTKLSATQEDIFIPSSCLNSTVSGLISRTVHNKNFIRPEDFHGVKIYSEFIKYDLSNFFINKISNCFKEINSLKLSLKSDIIQKDDVNEQILKIQKEFGIKEWNKVKPGIGETTRVLLRRNALFILIKDYNNTNIRHIMYLAEKKNIKTVEYKNMNYECMGIIT